MDSNSTPFKIGEFFGQPYSSGGHESVLRIWRECGWLEHDGSSPFVKDFYAAGPALVATYEGTAECAVSTTPGTIQYQSESLVMCAVTSVVTSHVARKRGLAKSLTAHALADAANGGAEVATLGIFEQGFYDALGFGSGGYEHEISFDPATLRLTADFRIPRRITQENWLEVSAAMKRRWLNHGACILEHPIIVKAELAWKEHGFGLGYFNDRSELTHFFFGKLAGEYGPLEIAAIAYQNRDQLLELLALLRSLGDQVSSVTMIEPAHVHLEDLLMQPFRIRRLSRGSKFESLHKACSWWQIRILDLEKCLRKTHLTSKSVGFNLVLTDPIEEQLKTHASGWRGVAGEYVVSFGEQSQAKPGSDNNLPTLHASVNAFTRMWFGVRPATHLASSDQLKGPDSLLDQLDATLRLPEARWGWQF